MSRLWMVLDAIAAAAIAPFHTPARRQEIRRRETKRFAELIVARDTRTNGDKP
ncbi:hypothetical protein [Micromonospora sp. NBRC 107095]|uniref:hypothetical protein n=1 Tax=Micromonospora sp. NBRC 107095 TaxID=3032209 RepID=UPI002553964F|nr:hypothetical protein [Micromonospora sp. NBRC 107095]